MAIKIKQEKNNKGIVKVIIAVVSFGLLFVGAYYLFFAPTPFVEVIIPPEYENISQFSDIDIDPSVITESETFKMLRQHVTDPEIGEFGRENPFSRF